MIGLGDFSEYFRKDLHGQDKYFKPTMYRGVAVLFHNPKGNDSVALAAE